MPERLSLVLRRSVTSLVYQPFVPSVPPATDAIVVGAVRSILMLETVALALLPALSVAVPVTDQFAPSDDNVSGSLTLARPESASLAANITVTGALYQPSASADRSGAPAMVGDIWSILTVSVSVFSMLPALSRLQ